jgi:hypothetical protein
MVPGFMVQPANSTCYTLYQPTHGSMSKNKPLVAALRVRCCTCSAQHQARPPQAALSTRRGHHRQRSAQQLHNAMVHVVHNTPRGHSTRCHGRHPMYAAAMLLPLPLPCRPPPRPTQATCSVQDGRTCGNLCHAQQQHYGTYRNTSLLATSSLVSLKHTTVERPCREQARAQLYTQQHAT